MAVAGTPDYEFTYVLDGILSEDEIKDYVGRISKFLTDNGGEVLATDEWGMKPLAYPIRNRNNGYYVNTHFKSDSELPVKIEKNLKIEEKVLRFLVLKMDAKMKRHYHAEQEKQEAEPEEAEEA